MVIKWVILTSIFFSAIQNCTSACYSALQEQPETPENIDKAVYNYATIGILCAVSFMSGWVLSKHHINNPRRLTRLDDNRLVWTEVTTLGRIEETIAENGHLILFSVAAVAAAKMYCM